MSEDTGVRHLRSKEDRLTKEDVMDALKKAYEYEKKAYEYEGRPLPPHAEDLANDIAHFEKVGWPKL